MTNCMQTNTDIIFIEPSKVGNAIPTFENIELMMVEKRKRRIAKIIMENVFQRKHREKKNLEKKYYNIIRDCSHL